MARNRVIGRGNALPWHLPADMKRFKTLTMGHPVIMGRRTFDTLARPLPGRRNIVLTRARGPAPPGVEIASTLDDALALVKDDREPFIAGGADVYAQALPRAHRIYLTLVGTVVEGDALFPDLPADEWALVEDEPHAADERHAFPFTFQRYERVT